MQGMSDSRRLIHHRPRLAIALLAGSLAAVLLPFAQPLTRLLVAWNLGVWLYLFSVGWMMFRATPSEVKAIAEAEDRSAVAVMLVLVGSAILSIVAIAVVLAGADKVPQALRWQPYLLTIITLVGSWLLLGVVFTIHYAHLYYRGDPKTPPLNFPGDATHPGDHPDYWDFLYFSYTIAVAVQTADVAIRSHRLRRVVLAQAVLCFMFNLAILGLSINIAAGLLGQGQ